MTEEPPRPDPLDRRASNAKLIAQSRSRLATSRLKVRQSEQLVQQSERLVPHSTFDPPRTRAPDRVSEAVARWARHEEATVQKLRETGISLRSYMEEVVVASQEIRWQACQTRALSCAQRALSSRLRRSTKKTPAESLV